LTSCSAIDVGFVDALQLVDGAHHLVSTPWASFNMVASTGLWCRVGLVSLVIVVMSLFVVEDAKTASFFDLFGGSSGVAQPPHCRTRQLNSRGCECPCWHARDTVGRGWVVGTSMRVGCGVNVGVVGEGYFV